MRNLHTCYNGRILTVDIFFFAKTLNIFNFLNLRGSSTSKGYSMRCFVRGNRLDAKFYSLSSFDRDCFSMAMIFKNILTIDVNLFATSGTRMQSLFPTLSVLPSVRFRVICLKFFGVQIFIFKIIFCLNL